MTYDAYPSVSWRSRLLLGKSMQYSITVDISVHLYESLQLQMYYYYIITTYSVHFNDVEVEGPYLSSF